MTRFATFIAAVLIPVLALAEPPRAAITGPKTGQPGDIIRLKRDKSIGTVFKWYCKPEAFPDGRPTLDLDNPDSPIVATRPGSYLVELIAANEEGIDRMEWVVTIQGAVPIPPSPVPPGPLPPIPPQPVPPGPAPDPLPAGKFGLARYVRDIVGGSIQQPELAKAAAFAANYRAIASQVAAGTITSYAAGNAEAMRKNRATAGEASIELWRNSVFVPLAAKLSELIRATTFNPSNLDDVQILYSEIAAGFAAAGGR